MIFTCEHCGDVEGDGHFSELRNSVYLFHQCPSQQPPDERASAFKEVVYTALSPKGYRPRPRLPKINWMRPMRRWLRRPFQFRHNGGVCFMAIILGLKIHLYRT